MNPKHRRSPNARPSRGSSVRSVLVCEALEDRRLLIAEGSAHTLDLTVDTSALLGNITAQADWGDGRTSSLTVVNQPAVSSLKFKIDYRLDTRNFFNTAAKRQLLQFAADSLSSKFSDSLAPIRPSGANTWTATVENPSSGAVARFDNLSIAANEILIFAGSRDLPGTQLGEGGTGGYEAVGVQSWFDTIKGRGQPGALVANPSDFATWGGFVTFDDSANWYFGADANGLGSTQSDFFSVAVHELAHVMGFGTAASWKRYVNGNQFTGPAAVAVYDGPGNVPLDSDRVHWREGLTEAGVETMMDPSLTRGVRKLPTRLDIAALDDIGWQLITPTARVTGSHVYGDNGLQDIRVTLKGSSVGETTALSQASITNVAPTLNSRATTQAVAGTPLNLVDIGSFSDPGFDSPNDTPPTSETFSFRIDWGDGSSVDTGTATIDRRGSATQTTLGSFNGTHTYLSPGTYTVRTTVTDDDGGSASQTFQVNVVGGPELILTLDRESLPENSGANAARLTVRRTGFDVTRALTVNLSSNDTSEIQVPASVNLAANQSEATVFIDAVDDSQLDGVIDVILQAQAGSIRSNSVTVSVTDHEPLSLTLLSDNLSEAAGGRATTARITLPFAAPAGGVEINLTHSPANQLIHPASIQIPSGGRFVEFSVEVRDDFLVEKQHTVQLTASASGMVSSAVNVFITDNDEPLWTNPSRSQDVNDDGIVSPLDSLLIINQLNLVGTRELTPGVDLEAPPYYDPSADGLLSPLDALIVINYLNINGSG